MTTGDATNGDGRAYGRPAGTVDDDLTSVNAGTPGGELLRRYWHPVALSEEATELTLAIRVLGEDLILFRDGSGNPGPRLPTVRPPRHDAALRQGGRLGIRCCYHGWLLDSRGELPRPAVRA